MSSDSSVLGASIVVGTAAGSGALLADTGVDTVLYVLAGIALIVLTGILVKRTHSK